MASHTMQPSLLINIGRRVGGVARNSETTTQPDLPTDAHRAERDFLNEMIWNTPDAFSSELDVQNTGQTVNIVLKQALSRSSLSFEAGAQHYRDGNVEPEGTLALTGQRGNLNYMISASALSGYNQVESYELSLLPDLSFNEIV